MIKDATNCAHPPSRQHASRLAEGSSPAVPLSSVCGNELTYEHCFILNRLDGFGEIGGSKVCYASRRESVGKCIFGGCRKRRVMKPTKIISPSNDWDDDEDLAGLSKSLGIAETTHLLLLQFGTEEDIALKR